MEVISENSAVSIGLLIAAITMIGGGIAWLTRLHSLASANKRVLGDMRERVAQLEIENNDIADRMARIETKIDFLIEKVK